MMPPLNLRPVYPAFIVGLTGLVVLLAQAFTPRGRRAPAAGLSIVGLVFALLSVVVVAGDQTVPVMAGSVTADPFALFFEALLLCITLVVVLYSPGYVAGTSLDRGEYYSLVLFSTFGMLGLVSSLDLISIFVALEIMSVALYALAGMRREEERAQEAAVKYFLTGAFSSSFLLYGIAILYGTVGSTSLAQLGGMLPALSKDNLVLPLLGAGLLLVGFGFKIASVPFHMWTPDVYEGAPTSITGFMAAGVKAAAFGALLRVFGTGLSSRPFAGRWEAAVAVLAIVTMIGGNLGALAQTSLKRMLAYSSIAHAGYLLTAVAASPRVGTESILFYLVGYAAVNLGAFGALAALARAGREPLTYDDLAGLATRRPALAAALTVFLVSLAGIPVSAGFVGKFYLFSAAVHSNLVLLALVGVLMSVVSAYYYLRVVVVMYMREPVGEDTWAPVGAGAGLALGVSAFVVLLFGVYPAPLLAWARAAAASLH